MTAATLKKYEEQFSESQTFEYLHKPTDKLKERNVMHNAHLRGKGKTVWYKSKWENLEARATANDPEKVEYRSKIYPYHSLHEVVIITRTPHIKAKEGYKIKFCEDLLINSVKEFNIRLNDVDLLDRPYNQQYLACYLKEHENWKIFSKELGNRSSLTEWTNELQSEDVSMVLPYFFMQDKSDAFPVQYLGVQDKLSMHVEYDLQLSERLLICDEEEKPVPFSYDLLEVEANMELITVPDMDGRYTTLLPSDVDVYASKTDDTGDGKEMFVEGIYYFEDDNSMQLGKKVQLKFDQRANQPVHHVFWGAMNKTHEEKYKCLSFSTSKGESPVKRVAKLVSSVGTEIDNSHHYREEKAHHLISSKPSKFHIGKWYNSIDRREKGKKLTPGIKFNGGSLQLQLRDKDSDDKFVVFAILTYVKRFRFKTYPQTQEERLVKGCTIEVDDDKKS